VGRPYARVMAPERVAAHVAAFNDAVGSGAGAWAGFGRRFTDDARMEFPGLPVAASHGRAAIVAAYLTNPPDDTLSVTAVASQGATDEVSVAWSRGGTGRMTLTWSGDLVARLVVVFD
jgi:hypothetical protein